MIAGGVPAASVAESSKSSVFVVDTESTLREYCEAVVSCVLTGCCGIGAGSAASCLFRGVEQSIS